MNFKAKKARKQVAINNSIANVLSPEEIKKRISEIETGMKASTWRELETKGKFTKNDKLSFINDDMLILGCVVAFIVALLAMKWFVNFLTKYGFKAFGVYRIIVGGIIIIMLLMGQSLVMVD